MSNQEEPTAKAKSVPIGVNLYTIVYPLAAILALITASECSSIAHLPSLIYGLVLWGWWAILASALWKFSLRGMSMSGFSVKLTLIHLPAAMVLAAIHLLLLWSLGFTELGWQGNQSPLSVGRYLFNVNRFGIEILIYGFVFGMIGVIQNQIRAQRDAMKSLELERQLSAAQLRALQMQLEPHFLFNTLHGISTLIDTDRARAKAMVIELSNLLRMSLQHGSSDLVTLEEEIKFLDSYLGLEKMRLGTRLEIRRSIGPGTLSVLVPQLILQPLVENAILHGIACCREGGWLEIAARRADGSLQLEIRNSVGGKRHNGTGLGLKNTRARLTYLYSNEATFSFAVFDDHIATATLVLPAVGLRQQTSAQLSATGTRV